MPNLEWRILLVDDDRDDYVLIRDIVYEFGGQSSNLAWTAKYDVGLEEMVHNRHDVYLIDYRLGERDGLELIREGITEGCTAPIILLSGQGSREVDVEAMKAGACDYLEKGRIDADLLERAIRYAIARKRRPVEPEADEGADEAPARTAFRDLDEPLGIIKDALQHIQRTCADRLGPETAAAVSQALDAAARMSDHIDELAGQTESA